MNPKRIIILGAGQALRPVVETLELLNASSDSNYDVAGALDDNPSLAGSQMDNVKILGPLSLASQMADCQLVWGLGNPVRPTLRLEIAHRLDLAPERFVTLVHPQAWISKHASLACGITIQSGAQIAAGVRLAAHVGVGIATIIEHDTQVGPGSLLAAGVVIAGGVRIGAGAYLGQGCNIINNAKIGDMAIVGMGSVVLGNVGDGETVVGTPAKVLRTASIAKEFYAWTVGLVES